MLAGHCSQKGQRKEALEGHQGTRYRGVPPDAGESVQGANELDHLLVLI